MSSPKLSNPKSEKLSSARKPTTSPNSAEPPRQWQPLFLYPALPRWEISFYFLVIIGCIIYAYARIYDASRSYHWDTKRSGGWGEYEDRNLSIGHLNLGKFRKDITNDEWKNWSDYARSALIWFCGHFLLLNLSEKLFPQFCRVQSPVWSKIILAYWVLAHCQLFGTLITGVSIVQGAILYVIGSRLQSRILIWILAVLLLYPSMQNPIIIPPDGQEYLAITLMSYKTLHFLSYVLDMMGEKVRRRHSFWEMMHFSFYLPYCISLIVTSHDQHRQWKERESRKLDRASTLIFGLRMLFWYFFAEFLTYFFYFEALMNDPSELMRLRKDTLVNVGMAVGQFFQLKYVLIFGFPAFFARLDRMQPLEGPICITRLTLYSKIWRFFDRGLYAWFKEYIYLPLCRPTFSIWRKLSALFVTYGFVLLWHGASHDYLVWVVLSVCEIFIEQSTKGIYSIPKVKRWREANIGDRNFRRLLAWLQVVTFAFGLYSNFYFLGTSEAGYVFVQRIFWEETVPVKWPFILLICLGYCQSHVCMEVDRIRGENERKKAKEGVKKE